MRGDARRLLLSRLVVEHRLAPSDPFRVAENRTDDAIASCLLDDRAVRMEEVGELLLAQ
jgi:acyl-CoA dehydrogenase